jgi:hypothetical protein
MPFQGHQTVQFGTNVSHTARNHHPPCLWGSLSGFLDAQNTQANLAWR